MGKSVRRPGFRFKPTDQELAMYHLKNKVVGRKLDPEIIAEVNIHDFSPWDLPAKSILSGDLEWYFFSSKSKKYSSGQRVRRASQTGYWKGTGLDKEVKYRGRTVAMKKTLVFHVGCSTKGARTNWVMHEYRMEDGELAKKGVVQDAYVICKVFEKSGLGPKNGAQYGAPFEEEDWDDDEKSSLTSSIMVGVLVNPNNVTCSRMINMTSIGRSSSTLTPSTRMVDPNVSTSTPFTTTYLENERPTVGDVASLQNNNNNNTQDVEEVEDPKGKKVMTVPVDVGDVTLQENDLGLNAFNMFTHGDLSYPWFLSHCDVASLRNHNTTQEVEDPKGKKMMSVLVNVNNVTFQEDDLDLDAFNMFSIDKWADDDNLDAYAFSATDILNFLED